MNHQPSFNRSRKLDLMRKLMWDYEISPEECMEVLEGKREKAGHYTEDMLFKKLLESFRWHTVLRLLPLERIAELLDDELIASLRFPSLRSKYSYVRERLQKTVPTTG